MERRTSCQNLFIFIKLPTIINENYREREKWVRKFYSKNQLPRPVQKGEVTKERSATWKKGRDTQRQRGVRILKEEKGDPEKKILK